MNNIIKAIQFATAAHEHQKRKGKEVSYIMHPLSVGLLLASSGAPEEIIIAGILHDTIEDTEVTYKDIEKEFGKHIADIVNDVTEQDKSLSWAERKRLALDHVATMHPDSLLVKTVDVLHNMSDQLEDYKKEGDSMFAKFNAGKEQQLERYEKLIEALQKRNVKNPLLPTLEATLAELKSLWK
ncbi:MAG: hypothetical protein RLZZ455_873 [Candidatus Parcubacteria bacterium]|jgi:(p)ppGpp synthase/HD superfamily hydrolase